MQIVPLAILALLAIKDVPFVDSVRKKSPTMTKKTAAQQMGKFFAILDKDNRKDLYQKRISNLGLFKNEQYGNQCARALLERYSEIQGDEDKLQFIRETLPIFRVGTFARKRACGVAVVGINKYTRAIYQDFLKNDLKCPQTITEMQQKEQEEFPTTKTARPKKKPIATDRITRSRARLSDQNDRVITRAEQQESRPRNESQKSKVIAKSRSLSRRLQEDNIHKKPPEIPHSNSDEHRTIFIDDFNRKIVSRDHEETPQPAPRRLNDFLDSQFEDEYSLDPSWDQPSHFSNGRKPLKRISRNSPHKHQSKPKSTKAFSHKLKKAPQRTLEQFSKLFKGVYNLYWGNPIFG